MANNGLLGRITLDVSGVMKSIEDLQKGLANLGKGGGGNGNINIPGIDTLKKSLDEVNTKLTDVSNKLKNLGSGGGSGGGGGGTGGIDLQRQALEKLIGKLVEMEQIQQRLLSGNASSLTVEKLTSRYEELSQSLGRFTKETMEQAKADSQYQKEAEKTLNIIDKQIAKIEQREAKEAASKKTQREREIQQAIERTAAAEEKRA